MKITNSQLRKIIKEALAGEFFSDREANPHDGSMYGEPEGGNVELEIVLDKGGTYMVEVPYHVIEKALTRGFGGVDGLAFEIEQFIDAEYAAPGAYTRGFQAGGYEFSDNAKQEIKSIHDIITEAGDPDLPRADDESWTIGQPAGSTDHLFPDDWGMPKYIVNDSSQDSPAQEPGTYSGTLIMSPNGDSVLVDGVETYIHEVPGELERITGEAMHDSDVDELIAELERQFDNGYVELPIEMRQGLWSW